MKKKLLIVASILVLAGSMHASQKCKGEHISRSAFKKKLKRVKTVGLRSFNAMKVEQNSNKKAVFIDWRKLYWGKLRDLIYSEEETYADDLQGIAETPEEQTYSLLDTEDAEIFAKELRQELKSFAKHYGLKILWRKKALDIIDGTGAFLEYWDKGLSQKDQEKILSFEELCSLSSKVTNVKDQNSKNQIKNTSHLNPDTKEGA